MNTVAVVALISTILAFEEPTSQIKVESPTRTADAFYVALKSHDCDAAFGMLTVESQTRPQFALGDPAPSERTNRHCLVVGSFLANVPVDIETPFAKAEVISLNTLPAGVASVTVRLSYEATSGTTTKEATHYLVQECGTWKIMEKPPLP